jgi:hypothetical protein
MTDIDRDYPQDPDAEQAADDRADAAKAAAHHDGTCHAACLCHEGGEPTGDFVGDGGYSATAEPFLPKPEVLHVRASGLGPPPDGSVAVVYADEWDDLCTVAQAMAEALRPFADANRSGECECPDDSHDLCSWCTARDALKCYEDADR